MNLDEKIIKALEDLEYEEATEIQKKVIPVALKKRDIIGISQSGTGKTAAFLLPILEEISKNKQTNPLPVLRSLIIVPTRELAKQIVNAVDDYAKHMDIKKVAIFGGVSSKNQARVLANGVDIIVATTGRIMEHIKNKTVNLNSVTSVVIDELDTMLDMGFLEEIEQILPHIGPKRQIMMFSATLSPNIKKLAKEFLKDPVVIEVSLQRSSVKAIDQKVILVDEDQKAALLSYYIGSQNFSSALVFVNMKKEADELIKNLELDGLKSACIHGDVRQTARAKALRQFKSGEIKVLVATDIAARGIDIQNLPVVINYSLPQSITDYTHRIGRTGRAGKKGIAITLLSVRDYKFMKEIEKELILDLKKEELEDFPTLEKKPRISTRPKEKPSSNQRPNQKPRTSKPGGKRAEEKVENKRPDGKKSEGRRPRPEAKKTDSKRTDSKKRAAPKKDTQKNKRKK